MRCDPRVISLTGIQAVDGTVENGNHLHAFVGVEHGFCEDTLAIYRRPQSDKLTRLRSFNLPALKDFGIFPGVPGLRKKTIVVDIETNDPSLTLPARLYPDPLRNSFRLDIKFPSVVGYLQISANQSPRFPGLTNLSGALLNAVTAPDIFEPSGYRSAKNRNTFILRNRDRTGLRRNKLERLLSRRSRVVTAIQGILWRLSEALSPKSAVHVQALYKGDLVTSTYADNLGQLPLINFALDEIQISASVEQGCRVEFLLMEEDTGKGEWTKVEELPGPNNLLAHLRAQPIAQLFNDSVKKRFWPDVENRFLRRGQDGDSFGYNAISKFYGADQFKEFLKLLGDTYSRSGWVERLTLGVRSGGGYRGHRITYASRGYDPDQLALLLTLTMDPNIATLAGLHMVDRGQAPNLPNRNVDYNTFKKYQIVDWQQPFDYKVEGRWTHLSDTYGYVFYDLSKSTTPALSGNTILESQTHDGVEINEGTAGNTVRQYKVGLHWDTSRRHPALYVIANDVYRNGNFLTEKCPITPTRTRERQSTTEIGGRSLPFNSSLPVIPPFSKPEDVKPAAYQYIDTSATFGAVNYVVESVDIFGRQSTDQRSRSHVVQTLVPIPAPSDLRAEIRQRVPSSFDVFARWDWPQSHRTLAPDWSRFEIFIHSGTHKAIIVGAILWISKHPTDTTEGKFIFEAFADAANSPVALDSLLNVPQRLKLRCAGRTYFISETNIRVGPKPGVSIVNGTFDAKNRTGRTEPSALSDGARGILFANSANGTNRMPFVISGTAEPEALTGAVTLLVSIRLNKAAAAQLSEGDVVRVLIGDFLLSGEIDSLDAVTVRSYRSSPTIVAVVQFHGGWAEYHLPIPTDSCVWEKADNSEWVDWNDAASWPIGPIRLDRPTDYPLQGASGHQSQFPVTIAGTPGPRINPVTNQAGNTDPEMSGVVLHTERTAVVVGGSLAGCNIAVGSFDEVIRHNLKGQQPQLLSSIPTGFDQTQASGLSDQQALISRSTAIYTGSINARMPVIGETRLEVSFSSALPLQEWQVGTVRASNIEALPSDTDQVLPPVSAGTYYFRIRSWKKLSSDGKKYAFVVTNMVIADDVTVDGVEQAVQFEVAPSGASITLELPTLHSVTFDLSGLSSAAFYRNVDGGEISYPVGGASGAALTNAVAVSRTGTGASEQLHVAFSPVLDERAGFRSPPSADSIKFYPSFQISHSPPFLNEDNLRNNISVHVTIRAIVDDTGTEFIGPLAPAVPVSMARGRLNLSPPAHPTADAVPPGPVYARPGSRGSTYALSWSGDAYEFKIYRISAGFIEDVRRDTSGPNIATLIGIYRWEAFDPQNPQNPITGTLDLTGTYPVIHNVSDGGTPLPNGYRPVILYKEVDSPSEPERAFYGNYPVRSGVIELRETDRSVLDDLSRVEEGLNLRNRAQLRQPTYTDIFKSRGAGRYYYRIIAVDKTGTQSTWQDSPIFPDPDTQGPLIVLDTIPPDPPALKPLKVLNGTVQIEWQSAPAVDEYWVYRTAAGQEPDEPIKLKVSDIDDPNVQPNLARVPIFAGTESEMIRCKGYTPELDLFWMPDMYKVIGLYRVTAYNDWLAGRNVSAPNLYPDTGGETVKLKHRDGTEEDIKLDAAIVWQNHANGRNKPGLPLVVEYLLEKEVRLPGYFDVQNNIVSVRPALDIAVLVGIYKIENFDPDNPQNPLSGTLDISGTYPLISNVRDGANLVSDGYRPVIVYKSVNSSTEPEKTIFGVYPVRNGSIALIAGPELPLINGNSATGTVTLPGKYNDPANAIVGVYKQADYSSPTTPGTNLYGNTYDGLKISGITLPNDEPVVVIARQLQILWADRVVYQSLRFEGYPQAQKIDEILLADPQKASPQTITFDPATFDPTNPDTVSLPAGSISNPPAQVIVRYTDDAQIQRSISVIATGDTLNIGRLTNLPTGISPHIKDFVGIWRRADYDPGNPDPNLKVVDEQDIQMYRRRGRFLQVHANAGLPIRENDEPVPLVIRFLDHNDVVHSITSMPGLLRFIDEIPSLNTTASYKICAVKLRHYRENAQPNHKEIESRKSVQQDITLQDSVPPVPPEIHFVGVSSGVPELRWNVIDNIAEYRVQRSTAETPTWSSLEPPLVPELNQVEMFYLDSGAVAGQVYLYRLAVKGHNKKPNRVFQEFPVVVDMG